MHASVASLKSVKYARICCDRRFKQILAHCHWHSNGFIINQPRHCDIASETSWIFHWDFRRWHLIKFDLTEPIDSDNDFDHPCTDNYKRAKISQKKRNVCVKSGDRIG